MFGGQDAEVRAVGQLLRERQRVRRLVGRSVGGVGILCTNLGHN